MFSIPNSPQDLMTNIDKTYMLWFQVWNNEYLPLIMDRPKWNQEEENLKEGDLVYFKLTDSKLSADWRYGKVEYAITGRDGKVRSAGISYKIMVETEGHAGELMMRIPVIDSPPVILSLSLPKSSCH